MNHPDDIAFTFQSGREEMAHRAIFLVTDIGELQFLLKEFIDQRSNQSILAGQANVEQATAEPIPESEPIKMASQWVQGAEVDWRIYGTKMGFRVPLPVYPFEKRRCWFEDNVQTKAETALPKGGDVSTSKGGFAEHTVTLRKSDYFIRDHIVDGRPILPGVAYFDIVGSLAERQHKEPVQRLKEIHWLAPIQVDDLEASAVEVKVALTGREFEVNTEQQTHMVGKLDFTPLSGSPQPIDLITIQERCPYSYAVRGLYQQFETYGLAYGETFQVIKACHYNEREALCRLEQSPTLSATTLVKLEPSMLDGVFQSVVALNILGDIHYTEQYLPFRLGSVTFYQPIPPICYAHVYQANETGDPQELVFDMRLYDERGGLIAVFDQLVKRPIAKTVTPLTKKTNFTPRPNTPENIHLRQDNHAEQTFVVNKPPQLYTYTSTWVEQPLTMHREAIQSLLLFEQDETLFPLLKSAIPVSSVVLVKPGERFEKHTDDAYVVNPTDPNSFQLLFADLAERRIHLDSVVYNWHFEPGASLRENIHRGLLPLLSLTKAIIAYKNQDLVRLFSFYCDDHALNRALHALIGGFSRTLAYENPRLSITTVGVDTTDHHALAWIVGEELSHYVHTPLQEVAYHNSTRTVRTIVENPNPWGQPGESLLRRQGCYLITGGCGGIGQVFAHHLAQHYQATIVMIGRSEQSPLIDQKLLALEELGGKGLYFVSDVAERSALQQVADRLNTQGIYVNGVIHAAGLIEDAFIINKSASSFERVIAPKVYGTINVDNVTQEQPLDFFMVLSSIAAMMPNQGQCDYAAANSFLDAFVAYRNRLWNEGRRPGVSISINWPLWENGGIGVNEEEKEHLWTVFGMKPLATDSGIAIFEKSLHQPVEKPHNHLIAIEGVKEKIDKHLGVTPELAQNDQPPPEHKTFNQQIKGLVNLVLAQDTSIGDDDIFSDLGLDSIGFVALANHINEDFELSLKPSIFFEYQTIAQLTHYLQENKQIEAAFTPTVAPTTSLIDAKLDDVSLIDTDRTDAAQLQYTKTLYNDEFFMRDHVVAGKFNVPGACYIEVARQACALSEPKKFAYRLTNNYWAKQLSSSGAPIQMDIQLLPKESYYDYEISSVDERTKSIHALGQVYACTQAELAELNLGTMDLQPIRARCPIVRYPQEIYAQIIAEGLHVGPTFMPMTEIFLSEDEGLAHLRLPDNIAQTEEDYLLHPTMLTGVLQTALLNNKPQGIDNTQFIPIAIDEILFTQSLPAECYIYTKRHASNVQSIGMKKFDAKVLAMDGTIVATMQGVSIRALATSPTQKDSARKEMSPSISVKSQHRPTQDRQLVEQVEQLLKELLSDGIGLTPAEIDGHTDFEAFGINSLMIIDLNRRLEDVFGNLSKTLFFEYKNFHDLAQYFCQYHISSLQMLLPQSTSVTPALDKALQMEPEERAVSSLTETFVPFTTEAPGLWQEQPAEEPAPILMNLHQDSNDTAIEVIHSMDDESILSDKKNSAIDPNDIAIIGAAGRYPGANNLSEFWAVLKNGQDCIREIPADRFDYLQYYDENKEHDLLYAKWGDLSMMLINSTRCSSIFRPGKQSGLIPKNGSF
ncbi:SDR family NAD(P)-dependent oxidoreductase [Chloroflexi bacterium TSY]|nr:SDR family NAD(P)-dependent oxidoreductase [Chloroflexi bacterium TSY]